MASSTTNGSSHKRQLDCFEILKNCEYASIESVCISIQEHPRQHVDNFMDVHYLQNDELLCRISEILRDCIIDKSSQDQNANKPLTAALLLILPFINCSASLSHEICEKYVSVYDRKENNNFCRGLVFALSWKVSIISLQTKTWIMCSLCHLIETQHALKISSKIKDAYNGLVRYSLQILQCQFVSRNININIKQYAIRILLCELNEGVMARQYLKDQYTNLIVLQSIIMLHEEYECEEMKHTLNKYNEYQWLMLKLLQFLYESFDFDDLWMSLDEYKHKTMSETEFNDDIKCHYLRNYLMTRCQFGRLLQMKCKAFLNAQNTKGILIRVACKLLLEYPLNDKYGLCTTTNHSNHNTFDDHLSANKNTMKSKHKKSNKHTKKNSKKKSNTNHTPPQEEHNTPPTHMNHKKRSYSGPNWHYEFQRLLRNEEDSIDPQLKLKLFYSYR
eukprot:131425_1